MSKSIKKHDLKAMNAILKEMFGRGGPMRATSSSARNYGTRVKKHPAGTFCLEREHKRLVKTWNDD